MASRERETYQIEQRIYVPFMFEMDDESKIFIWKLPVNKEMCSWLPLSLDGRIGCKQEQSLWWWVKKGWGQGIG